MSYHKYLNEFSVDEKIQAIKDGLNNSKEFVNLFLAFTESKDYDSKDILFNDVIDDVAKIIIEND